MTAVALSALSSAFTLMAWQAASPGAVPILPGPGRPVLYEWPASSRESEGSVLVVSFARCIGDRTEATYFATRRPSPYTRLTTVEMCNGKVTRYRFPEGFADARTRYDALGAYDFQGDRQSIPVDAIRVRLTDSRQLEALAASAGAAPRNGRVAPQIVHLRCDGRARWGRENGAVDREEQMTLAIDLDRANYTATVIGGTIPFANGKPLFTLGKRYPTTGIAGGGTQFNAERVSADVPAGAWRGNVRLSPDGRLTMAELYGKTVYAPGVKVGSIIWIDGLCRPAAG